MGSAPIWTAGSKDPQLIRYFRFSYFWFDHQCEFLQNLTSAVVKLLLGEDHLQQLDSETRTARVNGKFSLISHPANHLAVPAYNRGRDQSEYFKITCSGREVRLRPIEHGLGLTPEVGQI